MPLSTANRFILGLAVLILAASAGDVLQCRAALPVPGPVLGIVLLLLCFSVRRGVPEPIAQASRPLLRHLPLFFLPAGAGLITQAHIGAQQWAAIAAALLGSSVLSLLAVAVALSVLDRMSATTVHGADDPHAPTPLNNGDKA